MDRSRNAAANSGYVRQAPGNHLKDDVAQVFVDRAYAGLLDRHLTEARTRGRRFCLRVYLGVPRALTLPMRGC